LRDLESRLINTCVKFGAFSKGNKIVDIGCGSGASTNELRKRQLDCFGVDQRNDLIEQARGYYPQIQFQVGESDRLEIESDSLDGVLLSGAFHHLRNPVQCAQEVFRVLKPGGVFVAFDPNRRNPFMRLYGNGKTAVSPVVAEEVSHVFEEVGFETSTKYVSGIHGDFADSAVARAVMPFCYYCDELLSRYLFSEKMAAFVITKGTKRTTY